MSLELVSVIMPAFNSGRTIAQSIESVLDQRHRSIELIVIDDGSTDHTAQIVSKIHDPRIVFQRQARQGVGAARNEGLALARGSYIQYLDADDLLHEEKIQIQYDRLKATECANSIATCSWTRFYDDSEMPVLAKDNPWLELSPLDFLQLALGTGHLMPIMTWLIPRTVSDRAGNWLTNIQLFEVREYFTRIALASSKVLFCGEACAYYRSGQSLSLSQTRDRDAYRKALDAALTIKTKILEVDNSPATQKALADFFRLYSIMAQPYVPALAQESESIVAFLGGSTLQPDGRPMVKIAYALLGWKAASRLRGAVAYAKASINKRPGRGSSLRH